MSAETIEALTAKCALLAASLSQAEAEGAKATRDAGGKLEDCAGMLDCYASWHLALFRAIEHYTDAEQDNMEPLDMSQRHTVTQLAGIGIYLADQAYVDADDYKQKAKAMRGAA